MESTRDDRNRQRLLDCFIVEMDFLALPYFDAP